MRLSIRFKDNSSSEEIFKEISTVYRSMHRSRKSIIEYLGTLEDIEIEELVKLIGLAPHFIGNSGLLSILMSSDRSRYAAVKRTIKLIHTQSIVGSDAISCLSELRLGYLLWGKLTGEFSCRNAVAVEIDHILQGFFDCLSTSSNLRQSGSVPALIEAIPDFVGIRNRLSEKSCEPVVDRCLEIASSGFYLIPFVKMIVENHNTFSFSEWEHIKTIIRKVISKCKGDYMVLKGVSQLCIDMFERLQCVSWMIFLRDILCKVPQQHWRATGYILALRRSENAAYNMIQGILKDTNKKWDAYVWTNLCIVLDICYLSDCKARSNSVMGLAPRTSALQEMSLTGIISMISLLENEKNYEEALSTCLTHLLQDLCLNDLFLCRIEALSEICFRCLHNQRNNRNISVSIRFCRLLLLCIFAEVESSRTNILCRLLQSSHRSRHLEYVLATIININAAEVSQMDNLQDLIGDNAFQESDHSRVILTLLPLVRISGAFSEYVLSSARKFLQCNLEAQEIAINILCGILNFGTCESHIEDGVIECLEFFLLSPLTYCIQEKIYECLLGLYLDAAVNSAKYRGLYGLLSRAAEDLFSIIAQDPSVGKSRSNGRTCYRIKAVSTEVQDIPIHLLLEALWTLERCHSEPDKSTMGQDIFDSIAEVAISPLELGSVLNSFSGDSDRSRLASIDVMSMQIAFIINATCSEGRTRHWSLIDALALLHEVRQKISNGISEKHLLRWSVVHALLEASIDGFSSGKSGPGPSLLGMRFLYSKLRRYLAPGIDAVNEKSRHAIGALYIMAPLLSLLLDYDVNTKADIISSVNRMSIVWGYYRNFPVQYQSMINPDDLIAASGSVEMIDLRLLFDTLQTFSLILERSFESSSIVEIQDALSKAFVSQNLPPSSMLALKLTQFAKQGLGIGYPTKIIWMSMSIVSRLLTIETNELDQARDSAIPKLCFDMVSMYYVTSPSLLRVVLDIMLYISAQIDTDIVSRIRSVIDACLSPDDPTVDAERTNAPPILLDRQVKSIALSQVISKLTYLLKNYLPVHVGFISPLFCKLIAARPPWIDDSMHSKLLSLAMKFIHAMETTLKHKGGNALDNQFEASKILAKYAFFIYEHSRSTILVKKSMLLLCRVEQYEITRLKNVLAVEQDYPTGCNKKLLKDIQSKVMSLTKSNTNFKGKRKPTLLPEISSRRLRSRNVYIDECLKDEAGYDAFADLEDFIEL